jgi:hypothetical protein
MTSPIPLSPFFLHARAGDCWGRANIEPPGFNVGTPVNNPWTLCVEPGSVSQICEQNSQQGNEFSSRRSNMCASHCCKSSVSVAVLILESGGFR